MGGVRFDKNCYAGDSVARYIAQSITFPHSSIKWRGFHRSSMLLRESFLLYLYGTKFCSTAAVLDPCYRAWYVQESHIFKSNVPKIQIQSVIYWASSQGQTVNLLRLHSNLLWSESQIPLLSSTPMLAVLSLSISVFLYPFMTSCKSLSFMTVEKVNDASQIEKNRNIRKDLWISLI